MTPTAGRGGRPLRILHLITRLERGGSSDCTLWQAIGAARRGHRVTVATGPCGAVTPLLERVQGAPNIEIVTVPHLARPIRPWRDLRALAQVIRILRAGDFDVLHTHTSKAGAIGRLAALVARPGVIIHQPHGHLFYGYYGRRGSALVVQAERLLAPLCDAQIALTRRGAAEHLRRGIGRPGTFRVVRSGIDLSPWRRPHAGREAARSALGLGENEVAAGTLCRLEPVKGIEDLLEAFVRLAADRPRLRLVVSGDGPLRDRLQRRAAAAGLAARVLIDGRWRPASEVLPGLDLFVLASRNEGMGRALVEAMASGLPIVATEVGGVGEILEDGACGLLVPPGDPAAVATAIATLLDDAPRAAALGAAARRHATRFGAGRMTREILKVYSEVAA